MTRALIILTIILVGCNKHKRSVSEINLSKPEASEEFLYYLTTAHEYLTEQQDLCQEKYGLGTYERWFYNQETGLIEFFNGDTLKLRISYQEVGSISKVSNT